MAQNTAEDTNPSVDKTESSEVTCATNKTVPCDEKEKIELIDADTAELIPTKKQKIAEITDSHDSKERSNVRQVDCNGDPEEVSTLAKETSSVNIDHVKAKETKEDNPTESLSAEPRSSTENDTLVREEEKRLNEILKVVHADLDIKYFQKPAGQSVAAKSDDEDIREKEQQAVKIANTPEKYTTESTKERITDTAQNSVNERKDSRESAEKAVERSEVEIAGPPTAVSELINEEELGGDSTLSADPKDHIAEWVENSVKVDAMVPANIEEEDNKHCKRKNAMNVKLKKASSTLQSRKSQRIVSNIIKKSIKCLNKMHQLMNEPEENVTDAGKNSRKSPRTSADNIPQSQQNGAALPEEASTSSIVDKQLHCSAETSSKSLTETRSRRKTKANSNAIAKRKRKLASEEEESIGEIPVFKKCCFADREKQIEKLVGQKEGTSEDFARRAEMLRLQIETLDHLAHNKEEEWNNILSTRKLKEEAYLRLKRMTEVANFMERGNNLGPESVPLTNLWMESIASGSGETSKEKSIVKENLSEIVSQDSANIKKHNIALQETMKNNMEGDRKQSEASNTVTRKISEGRQGAKVPVQSIIDAYRSKNPEIVPRRGRRMRNSVNVSLTAGGAMVETGHNVDSRPSSTDSCKSNPNATDSNNSVSFKDVLIQFARMSQQSEPIKTPQNYPDVTLHPVPPSTASQNTAPQQTASLLHGILTKAQTPKPATFSPTLAKLLTAPERERSSPTATAIATAAPTTSAAAAIATATAAGSIPQQSASTTQHLLQAYHGSSLGAISELLSSSKARSEITITPVVNPPAPQSHSNNVIHVEDVEEDSAVIDDREGRYSAVVRDNREERDNPRCQGCQERAAQFVCAGCGNQWYCSRDCQVAAWDEHSDVCSG